MINFWRVAALVCVLGGANAAAAQGILERLEAKIDAVLKALTPAAPGGSVVTIPSAPVSPPPPAAGCATAAANSGGRFAVRDVVKVKTGTGGWQLRAAPSLELLAVLPGLAEGAEGVVLCVERVGADQWLQAKFGAAVGWAREGCCDNAAGAVVSEPRPHLPPVVPIMPPPGPIEPVPGASFYLAMDGNDNNTGSATQPFRTLQKAVPLLQAGDMLVVRQGTYDTGGFTKAGGETIFNTGLSWDKPIRIHAAPNEVPEFVRDLAPGSRFTIEQVRAGVHAPDEAQCKYYASFSPPGQYLPWPSNCWSGSPGVGYLWLFQDDTGGTTGALLDLVNNTKPIQYLEFKGINWNGRGIARNIISTSTMTNLEPSARYIRILNADIGYSAASAFSQPGTSDNNAKGERNESNITIQDSKIHHCGIPFDPLRKNPFAKYLHCLYGHIGGWWCIRCEIYDAAGGGWEPDGHNNGLVDSVIHDNSCLGAQVGGGDNHVVTGNIFYNNGCGEVQLLSGRGHIFQHNTLVAGPVNRELGLQMTFRDSLVADNIITGYKTSIYSLQPWDRPNRYINNLYDGVHQIGNSTIPPIETGSIKGSPMLDANYVPLPGSPAIKAASDGKNIGSKQ